MTYVQGCEGCETLLTCPRHGDTSNPYRPRDPYRRTSFELDGATFVWCHVACELHDGSGVILSYADWKGTWT